MPDEDVDLLLQLPVSRVMAPRNHRVDKMTQESPSFIFSFFVSWSHGVQAGLTFAM